MPKMHVPKRHENCLIALSAIACTMMMFQELWSIRERIPEAEDIMREYEFTYDLSLPLINQYDAVEVIRDRLTDCNVQAKVFAFGHIGDGS